MHLLLVESDQFVADHLAGELRRQGFSVDVVGTGAAVLSEAPRVDLVLLGLELPDLDGLEVCRRLREHCQVPIIGLSSRDTELDRVLGLQAGLDDHLTSPCDARELAARIDVVMRRVRSSQPAWGAVPRQPHGPRDVVAHGRLRINPRTREVRVDGRPVLLTRKEFDLLALLASEPGTVFSRGRIMATVWQDDSSLPSRTIDTHIGTLRGKLGSRAWIVTIYGVGFRLGEV